MKRRISTSDIWADFCAALTSYDGGMTVEQLLNDGWQFCKLPLGSTLEAMRHFRQSIYPMIF